MTEILVLDTNAFNTKGLAYFLRQRGGGAVLPSAAAAELYRHYRRRRGWDQGRFLAELRDMRVTVEPLDAAKALAAVDADEASFDHHALDALIAGHALAPGRILVTNNLEDFPQVQRKVTPASLLRGR